MLSIDTLVPDFNHALAAIPGGEEAARVLERFTEHEDSLSPRTAALARVAVAQRVGGPYARWVMGRVAERQGVAAEHIFLATAGSALDATDSLVVKACMRIASSAGRAPNSEFEMLSHLLGGRRATEVVAQVALAMLACEALAAVAPPAGAATQAGA